MDNEENDITEEVIMMGQEIEMLNDELDVLREKLELEQAKNEKLLWILGLTNSTALMDKID